VFVRKSLWLAAVGLCLAQAPFGRTADLPAGEPVRLAPVPTDRPSNQKIAETIATTLRQSGQLRHYTVDISFQAGTADLSGVVADPVQREQVLRIVQGVPGVERVRDRITLADSVRPVAASDEKPTLAAPPDLGKLPLPDKEIGAPPVPAPPKMPPYAWPTYAPYNNFSRVACPTAYPYNSWPFIGPIYPFPKVPLGWRSVKLEFEDGYWWFSKTASKYDWWRLRYR
jgi:hypothetical protein